MDLNIFALPHVILTRGFFTSVLASFNRLQPRHEVFK